MRRTVVAPSRARRAGRPRSAAADESIREATLELLSSDGYANLTMSSVAARAGVSTATLYRRWSAKLDLVVDVLRAAAEERPVPDTGSFRDDCREILEQFLDSAHSDSERGTRILPGLLGEMGRNPDLAAAVRTHLIEPRRAALTPVLDRARRRRELRADLDDAVVVDLLVAPLYHRLLVTGGRIDAAFADELADLVAAAVGPRRTRKER